VPRFVLRAFPERNYAAKAVRSGDLARTIIADDSMIVREADVRRSLVPDLDAILKVHQCNRSRSLHPAQPAEAAIYRTSGRIRIDALLLSRGVAGAESSFINTRKSWFSVVYRFLRKLSNRRDPRYANAPLARHYQYQYELISRFPFSWIFETILNRIIWRSFCDFLVN